MRNLATLLAAPFEALAKRSNRNEQALIDDPRRARRLMLRDFVTFVVVLTAAITRDWLDGVLHFAAVLLVAWYVGWGALNLTRRMQSYRSGWIAGRGALMHSMGEARRRGMRPEEWAEAELARDLSIMGIEPEPPPPPDGSHDDI